MTAYPARKFLAAAGILAGLCFINASAAAERNRESPHGRYNTSGTSLFDLFGRSKTKKKRSYLVDYLNTKRKYRHANDGVLTRGVKTRPVKKKVKYKRRAAPAPIQVVEERPEPPLVYEPEKLETLRADDLTEAMPPEPPAAAVYQELQETRVLRVAPAEKQALVDFYRRNQFRPLWTSQQGLDERGQSVLRLLAASAEDGLAPEDYLPPSLARFDDDLTFISGDLARLARLDLELSARALRYARHASGGRLVPNKLTIYHDIKPKTVDLAAAMQVFAWSPFPAEYLKSLQPRHKTYATLKVALAGLRGLRAEPEAGVIGSGRHVTPGQSDPRVALARRHLAWLGYVGTGPLPGDDTVLDDALSARLEVFQADARIKQTGMLDAATVAALNSRDSEASIARLAYNMERLRWLPETLGKRYVLVNQPAYSLQVVDEGREIWRTKVVIGRTTSQTVAFSDRMETIVFNPSWGIPPTIMKNEMLPRLKRDPGYLDRIGYRVLARDGKIVKSRSVRWSQYTDAVPYLVLQPPSDDNAMGEVKFLFPNAHSIYMHDTPSRSLFKRSTRALSHGCVRVQNPRQFAEVLLGLDSAEIAALIDSGKSQTNKVTRETAVHLAYFTAWPEDDGRIVFYDDVYGRDERMERAFTTVAVAVR